MKSKHVIPATVIKRTLDPFRHFNPTGVFSSMRVGIEMNNFLSHPKELSEQLGVSLKTMYGLIRDGEIHSFRFKMHSNHFLIPYVLQFEDYNATEQTMKVSVGWLKPKGD